MGDENVQNVGIIVNQLIEIGDREVIVYIENGIRKITNRRTRVVSLDIAKQNTDKGLAFTLFRNLLRNLDFLDTVYGYVEYQLYLDGEYPVFLKKVKEITGEDWLVLRRSSMRVASTVRKVLTAWKYNESEYEETINHLNSIINDFSAAKLKDELKWYLEKFNDETIVFIFDEASEAISQHKFTLLDLEGLSEPLSGISSKVWTIAIAQEKLDDVINNNNVSKSQLTKVTDRFKTKIHLESTEVDLIIRNRLLQKTEDGLKQLDNFFDRNPGEIAENTNLRSTFPTKSDNKQLFSIYYPFHEYQFKLLQNFLFASNALTATQVAARGMIITTFDVLRKKLGNLDTFNFATAFDICDEAQTAPPAALVNKYDSARQILKDTPIDGTRLLKAIHFLSESGIVDTTAENIAKVYIPKVDNYFVVKPQIDEALDKLTSATAKVLLESNNKFKITSDLETKILDEMNSFTVEHFIRKRELISRLKQNSLIRSIAGITDNSVTYNFLVISDQDDELIGSSNKDLRIEICSLYNITDIRIDFIETIKQQTQNNKNKITLIPDNSDYNEINRLIEEIRRFLFIADKYGNDSDVTVRQIVREFSIIKDEKEKDLLVLINKSYTNCTAVYLFNAILLNQDNFKPEVNSLQKKVLDNVFNKRPPKQLSEGLALSIIKEKQDDKLARFNDGSDFAFFDSNGNFVGENLQCIDSVTSKIKGQYLSGKDIELEMKNAPTGYEYGTVASLVAVLFRAGRLTAKFNGNMIFSYRDDAVSSIFSSSKNFQKASFKSLSKSMTTAQKNDIVQVLRDLKIQDVTSEKVDWNTNDFQLIESVRTLAEYYINAVRTMVKTQGDFETLFGTEASLIGGLHEFSGKVTEGNFLDTAEKLLLSKEEFQKTVKKIEKIEKFIKSNLLKARKIKLFVDELKIELEKANASTAEFEGSIEIFDNIYSKSVVDNYKGLLAEGQKLKDAYHKLMIAANKEMSDAHATLSTAANATLTEVNKYPEELNRKLLSQVKAIADYADKHRNDAVSLDYSIKCANCHFSLSEMINYTTLAPNKISELQVAEMSIVKQVPPTPEPMPIPGPEDSPEPKPNPSPKPPKRLSLKISRRTTVGDFKKMLQLQLQQIAGMLDSDEIEIDL